MTQVPSANADQAEYWNTDMGKKWVTHQSAMDALLAPVLDAVLDLAVLQKGESILDIGCGSGTSTIAAAKRVGRSGRAVGADISQPMLDAARAQAKASGLSNVSFILADAAEDDLDQAPFDALISRFGVMFFVDPVAAFRHMTTALKPTGRIAFACWGQIEANPWFVLPAQAAKVVLGPPEKVDPDAPGPFAMRDTEKLYGTLCAAGLRDIMIEPSKIHLTPPGTLKDVTNLSCKIGPAARTLAHFGAGPVQEKAVIAELGRAFEPFKTSKGIRIPAEINLVTAKVS